jgi:hopene-associated glycosyltransferase HpnB
MLALACLAVWVYLFFAHGRFWASGPELPPATPSEHPDVDIIVPARDERETVGPVVESLLAQAYRGRMRVILVDDASTDGTATAAQAAADAAAEGAAAAGLPAEFTLVSGAARPSGWSGKLWAVQQGVAAGAAPLLLLTDADIVHDPRHLAALVAHLTAGRIDMVSEMVRLNCTSLAERALVPAFVYFFQMLYPFARVNAPDSGVAAAAGGTVLIRRAALEGAGGIEAIKGRLIDDVSLARVIKPRGPIFLGHSGLAASIRPYPHFRDLWSMIARTAFTQLRYSAGLLLLTIAGLSLVWLAPLVTLAAGNAFERACGAASLLLAAASFLPTLRRYGRSPAWVLALPAIAVFYMAATVGSALDHWTGRGARWKNRAYAGNAQSTDK